MSRDVRDPRLFDFDPETGMREFFIYDPDDDSFVIHTQQESESEILELNAEIRKDNNGRFGELALIAHIPAIVMHQLHVEGILQDPDRRRRWLNDSNNRCFRVREGRI
jgi:hypothetical protein